ncbi:MAG: MFS transporter [Chloroflexi bacterium]|nr:MFS transporter [Chloroflexota bacterium]
MDLSPTVAPGKRPPFSRTFQALRHHDFRLYWLALIVSLTGVAFQTVAQGWLVYRLTNSALMLAVVGFIPAVLSAPASVVGGILADRFQRRKLITFTQALMVLPPTALASLIWSGKVQVWHVIVASTVLGIVAAIDLPARAALIPQMVGEDDLLNAQGLSSMVYQVSRIVGPALAGLVIAASGEALCFLLNGLSYGAMVVALLFMHPGPDIPRPAGRRKGGLRGVLLDGLSYTLKDPILLGLLIVLGVQGMFLSPYNTLLPVFAKDILHVDARGFGGLGTAAGIGALISAFSIANMQKGRRGLWVLGAALAIAPVMVAFAWSPWYVLSWPLLLLVGMGMVLITTITGTIVLIIVPDEFRGRVNSLVVLIYLGAPFIGGLPVGYVAQHWSAPVALSLSAAVFFVSIVVLLFAIPQLRRLA